MRLPVLTALLLASLPTAPLAVERSLPFDLLDDGSSVIPVTIGQAGLFRFLLDTGSTRTAVSQRLMGKLRLPIVAQSRLVTPAGQRMESIVQLPPLVIADLPPVSVTALVSPRDDLASGARVDGLIGQDVLASLVYTIDYRTRRILWHDRMRFGNSGLGTRLPLDVNEGRFMVSLQQGPDESTRLRLIPDSGADGLVLFASPSRRLPALTPLDVVLISTLSGHTLGRRVVLDALQVGDLVLRNQPAVVVQRRSGDSPFGDGLLPLHLFDRVTFNGPEGYLIVEKASIPPLFRLKSGSPLR